MYAIYSHNRCWNIANQIQYHKRGQEAHMHRQYHGKRRNLCCNSLRAILQKEIERPTEWQCSKKSTYVFICGIYLQNYKHIIWVYTFCLLSWMEGKRLKEHVGLWRTSSVRISFCQDTTCIFNSLAGGRVAIVTMHSLRRLIHCTVTMFL